MLNSPVTSVTATSAHDARTEARQNDSRANHTARAFNTALLGSQVLVHGAQSRDLSTEILQLTRSPAFQIILQCIQSYASSSGLSETDAASSLIDTFKKIDSLWSGLAHQEGVAQLRALMSEPNSQE